MASDKIFVSPGVYTSEKNLTFVTKQVGVTTTGLVGETVMGPAFQPIFITNYDEYKTYFGGLNPEKFKDNGAPKYELSYIAKSYLEQSNQLYVTRVLGLSGYDAGLAWGITLDAALDPSTTGTTYTGMASPTLIQFTADTSTNTITSLQSSDTLLQTLWNNGLLNNELEYLINAQTGNTATVGPVFDKTLNTFTGISITQTLTNEGTIGSTKTGITSGYTIYYSGTGYSEVEDKLVALLRSRAKVNSNEIIEFELTASTDVGFSTTVIDAETDGKGDFELTGTARTIGSFNYNLSFDKTKKNYIKRVLGSKPQDAKTALYVEELFDNMFNTYYDEGKIRGINIDSLINYSDDFSDYQQEYQSAVTPWIVSELRGNKVLKLFRFWTISDGDSANDLIKISIKNIDLSTKEFDVEVRSYYDTDNRPVVLESFTKCSLDPNSNKYIAKKIGTLNGDFTSKSKYILVEMEEEVDTSDAIPAGFLGYPIRDYQTNGNTNVQSPNLTYKTSYVPFENKRKSYLGLTETIGFDQDFFDYKGIPQTTIGMWTGTTHGFHLDINASNAIVENSEIVIDNSGNTITPNYIFDVGNSEFKTESGVIGTDYEKIYARKFTLVPYGGFDGWDVYRTRRTNTDRYIINGSGGSNGLLSGVFKNRTLSNGEPGINSDYYAYLEGIWTFKNPESVNINVFATPGIDTFDNTNLIENAIEMIETDRADSIYIVTTPDVDASGTPLKPEDVVNTIDGLFDSNYTATYWPWVQIEDTENNTLIYIPPTRDVIRNIALTDNISFPWFASAGIQRGHIDAVKPRVKLTFDDREILYAGRINPITYFASEGASKIWGNKTLQINENALSELNVRRLLLRARKLISAVSIRLLFEQNDEIVRNQFLSLVNPILDNIRKERGLEDFKVELDDSPESRDRREIVGKIFIKPTHALEFIKIEFNITDTGASFEDI